MGALKSDRGMFESPIYHQIAVWTKTNKMKIILISPWSIVINKEHNAYKVFSKMSTAESNI